MDTNREAQLHGGQAMGTFVKKKWQSNFAFLIKSLIINYLIKEPWKSITMTLMKNIVGVWTNGTGCVVV